MVESLLTPVVTSRDSHLFEGGPAPVGGCALSVPWESEAATGSELDHRLTCQARALWWWKLLVSASPIFYSVVSAGLCAWAWCWSSCARVTSVTSCQRSPVGWAPDKCTAEAVSQTFYWPVVDCDRVVLRLATGSGWRWWLGVQVNNLDGW